MNELTVLPKDTNESNSQYAYRVLYFNIMRMVLYPGQKIIEHTLTEALGISNTPFRQALSRLRDEGLVDIRSQSSTTVSFIDHHLLQENIFMRATLEAAVIEQLCTFGLSTRYHNELEENLAMQKLMLHDDAKRERFFEMDVNFHRILFEAAGKQWTYASICKSCAQLDRARYMNALSNPVDNHFGIDFFYADHISIFECILHGDTSSMLERMYTHINGSNDGKLNIHPGIAPYLVNVD